MSKRQRFTEEFKLEAVFDFIDNREIATALKHRAHAL